MRVRVVAAGVFLLATAAPWMTQVQGQQSAAPAFEAASIKPSNPEPSNPLSALPLILPMPGGRLAGSTVPLRILVLSADQQQDFQLVGGLVSCSAELPTPD